MRTAIRTLQKPTFGRCCVVVVLAMSASASSANAADDTEGRLVLHVCGGAAEVEAGQAEIVAGDAAVTAAGVLPNPSLILQHQQTVEGPSERETVVGVGVPLGLGGRRFKRQDAAELRRLAGHARAESTAFASAMTVQAQWTFAALSRARADAMARRQAGIDELGAVVVGLARAGEAASFERDRYAVKAARHRAETNKALARSAGAWAELEAWGATGDAPKLAEASLLGTATWPQSPPSSPRLDALAFVARADEVDAEAARRAWVPDVDLFGGYRNVGAGDAVGHGVAIWLTVPVTLFDHGQGDAAVAEAAGRLGRARVALERESLERRDRALSTQLAKLDRAAHDAEAVARDAERVAETARKVYQAGESSLTDLFDALDDAERAELVHLDTLGEIAEARIAWMEAHGVLLDASLGRACREAGRKGTR